MRMTPDDWANTKYFSANEKWGDPYQMDKKLISLLDDLREMFHHPFIIHCGYETSGHSENSQHYIGKAVDFHIKDLSFKDAVDLMIHFINNMGIKNEVGLGIYPHWNNPGFHLDVKPGGRRWGFVYTSKGYNQVSFEYAYGKIKE